MKRLIIPQLKPSTLYSNFSSTSELRRELTRLTNRYLKQKVLPLNTVEEFIVAIGLYIDWYNSSQLCNNYFCIHTSGLARASVIQASTADIIINYFNYILESPRFKDTTFLLLARDFAVGPVEFRATVILPVIKLALQKHLIKRTAP